jgi:nitroreductase
MDFYQVMRTTFACREFTGEPLSPEVLHRIIDNARFAPSGGNRQGWRVINVVDDIDKGRLADLSLPTATRYLLQSQAGENPLNTIHPTSITDEQVSESDLVGRSYTECADLTGNHRGLRVDCKHG